MAKTSREYAIALLWKQNEEANVNYGKSIGIQNGYESDGFTVHADKIIDFEEGAFYCPPGQNTIAFRGSDAGGNVDLKVNGNVDTDEIKIGNVNLKSDYNNKLILSKTTSGVEKTLNIELKEEGGVVATESKLNAVKNNLVYDKNNITAFLEIIKFIPALADKRAEIEDLVESINQGE